VTKPWWIILLVLTSCAPVGPARAADLLPDSAYPPWSISPAWRPFDEVRLGGFAHGVGNPERGSWDVNGEVLSSRLIQVDDPAWTALSPRLHVGATINTAGQTSQGYFGLTWTYDILPAVFVEGSFGGSVNNGFTGNRFTPFDHAKLGCHVLFLESASLGYRITDQLSVMATFEHISNGNLCDFNRGLNNVGLRIGYSF
jgi:hypothetical protein